MTNENKLTISNGIDKFGEMQLVVAIEELSELQKELCKAIRGKKNIEHITEELADCLIMCETVKQYFSINNNSLQKVFDEKLARIK